MGMVYGCFVDWGAYWASAWGRRECAFVYCSQHQGSSRPFQKEGVPDPRLRDEDPGVRCSPALAQVYVYRLVSAKQHGFRLTGHGAGLNRKGSR